MLFTEFKEKLKYIVGWITNMLQRYMVIILMTQR